MIVSASRRTDIPAFYCEWFFNRIRERFVLVRNPMSPRMVSRVRLDPAVVDCIVFWTKNPAPMLPRLGELKDYHYYFTFTVNPYGRALEAVVPRKAKVIDTFRRLADMIGPHRVVWRYDPILLAEAIDIDYHIRSFEAIAQRLEGYTERCMIGFIDMYRKTRRNMAQSTARGLTPGEMMGVASGIAPVARQYGIELQACSEEGDYSSLGIVRGSCIDPALVERVAGYPIAAAKDRNQRPVCRCAESIDIGAYDSCPHDCIYCYANNDLNAVGCNIARHDPLSPLLIGHTKPEDIIKDRRAVSLHSGTLFD